MPTRTGTEIARAALKEIGVLDPIEAGDDDVLQDVRDVADDLIDAWRTESLFVSGITRAVYSLISGQQAHTIGTGGDFNQDYPTAIRLWSVIPVDTATKPLEMPRGRPATYHQWQALSVKSLTGAYPTTMWFDKRYAAGLGRCQFHPVPDNSHIDVVLYTEVPAITSLDANTAYTLQPAMMRALRTGIALELCGSGRYEITEQIVARVKTRAAEAKATVMRANYVPDPGRLNPAFAGLGRRRRTSFNVYSGE